MQQRNIRVIISGGGTGGHIFPAIAIANALKKRISNIQILFVGAEGKMEMQKVPAAGYHIIGLPVAGLQRKITLKNLIVPFKLMISMMKAKRIIKKFKPDVVIGVGGYASGPILRVATSKKIPTVIQEQNSYPGITNKILSKKVDKICVAYNGMEKYFPKEKVFITGNPVRQDIVTTEGKRNRGLEFFNLNPEKKTILVVGGSLGARSINLSIDKNIELFAKNDIQLIWQTGKGFYSQAKETVKNYEFLGIKAYDFITKMDFAYSVADIVVSRAGAIAISEICAVKKPAILIPLPTATEDHQTKNAMSLVNYNAAILVKDSDAINTLGEQIIDLINDDNKQNKLKNNLSNFDYKDSADVIANVILSLIKL